MLACNDSMLMESCIFHLLRQRLCNHPCYLDLIHMIHEGFRITSIGQCLDILTEKSLKQNLVNRNNFTNFNEDCYRTIVAHKTSFYSFVMPVRLALFLSGQTDSRLHGQIQSIMMSIGEIFQIQDDFLDCFGNFEQIGKIGTDIQDGKCSWLVVQALKLTNMTQRELLDKHYGQGLNDSQSEQLIKDLYKELNLDQKFQQYHQYKLSEIMEKIQKFHLEQPNYPIQLFIQPLSNIFIGRNESNRITLTD